MGVRRDPADSSGPSAAAGDAAPDIWQTVAAREAALFAPYAMRSADSAGRRHAEPAHPYRGPFQRDRDRIVHSAAYRRLGYKTQVFTGELGDYHRSRLTHTLEVSSIARTLGRALRLNEDLVEALALVHDIGHPPFGHCGEDVLDECLAGEGGFSHNRQALRIVEELERRYHDFPGLNLSQEVLDGQATRIDKGSGQRSPLLEVQVVEAADSIAYDTHDADDAMELKLLTLEELLEVPLWREAARRVTERSGPVARDQLRRSVLHELIDWQVGDLLERAGARLAGDKFPTAAEVTQVELLITPAPALATQKAELESFLFERVYRHPTVMAVREQAADALRAMFQALSKKPELMPPKFQERSPAHGLRRTVADYLSGMTDRFAMQEFRRRFGE